MLLLHCRRRARMCTTKVVFRPNCELINNYGQVCSAQIWNPNQTAKIYAIFELLKFFVYKSLIFLSGNQGLETENTYSVFRIILRDLYGYALLTSTQKNLDYCVYYFLKTSALPSTVTQLVFLEYFEVYSKHMSQKHMVNY